MVATLRTRGWQEKPRVGPARHHVNRAKPAHSAAHPRSREAVRDLVLDSPAVQPTLAWIYSDEMRDSIRTLFDQVADEGALVSTLRLWRLEVANSLTPVAGPMPEFRCA